ncbi:Rieske (2Fe-2S) protein [Cupriavidus basilensis]|uniref:Rieske (2Fe-2S) protein n=1 Tax=Cupriavidus basilensis TaxID=68895 RepID=UPI0039F65E57
MSEWIDVAPADEFKPETCRTVDLDGVQVAVFNVGGSYYAVEDMCSHESEPLCGGDVEGEEVVCPRHGAHFSLITGAALSPPAYDPVAVFPVRVMGGTVQIKDDRWD